MSSFFNNFPIVPYLFGNEIDPALFQNLSVYIDLVDQIADDASFYEKYTIIDGERPDTLSYKLYGTTDYHWTFYLLNEKLRQQGWPLTVQEFYTNLSLYYPHLVITTEESIFDSFKVNDIVIQGSASNPTAKGRIVEKNIDLGQLVVQPLVDVRSITVTSGGAGYTFTPRVTISGGGGSGATALASLSDDLTTRDIDAINIVTGGEGFTSAPTVTVQRPTILNVENVNQALLNEYFYLINYAELAADIIRISNGETLAEPYNTFLTQTIDNYARGNVTRTVATNLMSADDAAEVILFGQNPALVSRQSIRARIETVLLPGILQNRTSYEDWLLTPEQLYSTATATATISTNNFLVGQQLSTVTGNYNNINWSVSDIESISLKSIVNQYDAVHHYENTAGRWIDVDPTDLDTSTSGLIPITYKDRLDSQNTDLKEIKILKPNVASQVFSEFQRLLTRR